MDDIEIDQNISSDSDGSNESLKLFPLDRDSSIDSPDEEPEKLIPLDSVFYKSDAKKSTSKDVQKKSAKEINLRYIGNKVFILDDSEDEIDDEQCNVATQTTTDTISVLSSVNTEIRQKIEKLEANICSTFFSVYKIKDDKSMLMFTGFTRNAFNSLSRFLSGEMYEINFDPLEQFFIFCVYLKTGVSLKVFAKMCGFPFKEFSRMIMTNVEKVYVKLKTVNMWSTKKEIEVATPSAFKIEHPPYRTAIGCLKIPINSKPENRNKSLKGFVAVSPFSGIAFISNLYPGYISYNNIIVCSGILEKLEPADAVLANIDIEAELLSIKCTLTAYQSYHSKLDVKSLRMLLQMQVEQVIGKIKKYGCCKQQGSKSEELMDKLFYISAFFVNYQEVIDNKGSSIS